MAQYAGKRRTGPHPQKAGAVQPHLQGVGQFHRQRGPGGREWPEPSLPEPCGIPEGGQHCVDQEQNAAAPQGRAKGQEDKASCHASQQRGHGVPPRLTGRNQARRQRRAALQAAPGGKKACRYIARQPQKFPGRGFFQGDIGNLHSLSPSPLFIVLPIVAGGEGKSCREMREGMAEQNNVGTHRVRPHI